ncbi:thiamine pyrophosphokinase [Corynebacterium testudinoris]|uniref:Putative membrane-anchored protein n=1 Tax=Corynebacterium testudinoris TaxID=136857 RepID=A0A0G3H7G9_9CORY|nr:putative cytokinetic ring protein SteA [Corynebacterium testudinoris]AKK08685.1 putative membrane-anchored protein [Corynebacterium testudinoris]MBX8996990.1 thiamine pyrophosphokinase [Corynebacterium testudinoris]
MSLFSRNVDLPGLQGPLRDCTSGKGVKRLRAGDLAVVNAPDITRQDAQRLLDASPAAVINLARFSTGAVPNFGPHMLLEAGILLVEGAGDLLLDGFKDGKRGRITDDGGIHVGEKTIGSGQIVNAQAAEASFTEAQQGLVDHMEAYFGNTIQFIHSEGPLLIDGLGIPDTGAQFQDRKVLVVSPGPDHRDEVKHLRNFIREYSPVIIGVDEAADTLLELGYKPDLIVGNPAGIGADVLRSGARVVLPADPDGHAAGLERIQDLGIGAMTFPTATDSATDLALLLADYHGAQLIVNAGSRFDLDAVFAHDPSATPSALLTRTKVGAKLVDAKAITELYVVRGGSNLAWLWAVLGIIVALAAIILIVGLTGSDSFVNNLIDTWNGIALTVQGWFK